jgi:ABC-2 type transport system permease protein
LGFVRSLNGPYPGLALAGFRRYSTYRQAMISSAATNVVFGVLRVAVLTSAIGSAGRIGGYDVEATTTYVWLGQGLIGFVHLWGDSTLSDRVRSGDVVVDLHRPWNLQAALLAEDLGRCGYAVLTRLLPPIAVGSLFFPFRWPPPQVVPLLLVSLLLAVVISFGVRFLVGLSAFWLLDNRGVTSVYVIVSGVLCGLSVPLDFFPGWARFALWFTPFPGLLQSPIDVHLGLGPAWVPVLHQAVWAALLCWAGHVVLRRAVRKVVVQGG